MTLYDSGQNQGREPKRGLYRYMYIVIFMAATSLTAVILSISGHITLNPLTAFVASLFAGFAFLLFQITYVKFIANSAQSTVKRELEPDIQ
ncbi:MAG: hypothetical protein ACXADC_06210 [Candidatus Thorarchaeota archaeon]|jgi:hypothetical protein